MNQHSGVVDSDQATRRLFFALWPDASLRAELAARRGLLGDLSPRMVPDHNLHLTLAFLGNQPIHRVDAIQRVGDACAALHGQLRLDQFGWFSGARVAWLGGRAQEPLRAWVAQLGTSLERAGVHFQPRAFRPHVTLFRRVLSPPAWPECPPLLWPLTAFSLIESMPSRPYQVLRTWSL